MRASATILALSIAASAAAAPTAFVNVNVIPMDEEIVLASRTVIIEGGRIAHIGDVDAVPVPPDAVVVDGTDRYLLPGLAEMHAHVTAASGDELDWLMTLFVANGVTTIRGMLGEPRHLELRAALARGEVFGPTLWTSGPSLNGRSVQGAADARRMVREQHAAGYDFAKIHPGLDGDEFEAIAGTANALGFPFAGHVPVAVGVAGALAADMATIDHLDGYMAALLPPGADGSGGYGGFFDVLLADQADTGRIEGIARLTAEAGTANVPTQSLIENRIADLPPNELLDRPGMRYVPEDMRVRWLEARQAVLGERGFDAKVAARAVAVRRQLIAALHGAGAPLLLGSDAPQVFNVPGFSLHQELEILVASGLSPFEALETGTVNVAGFLDSNAGSVRVGRDADLVLLDADPLADIRNARRIHGVMLRGRWLDAAALRDRLRRFEVSD